MRIIEVQFITFCYILMISIMQIFKFMSTFLSSYGKSSTPATYFRALHHTFLYCAIYEDDFYFIFPFHNNLEVKIFSRESFEA